MENDLFKPGQVIVQQPPEALRIGLPPAMYDEFARDGHDMRFYFRVEPLYVHWYDRLSILYAAQGSIKMIIEMFKMAGEFVMDQYNKLPASVQKWLPYVVGFISGAVIF